MDRNVKMGDNGVVTVDYEAYKSIQRMREIASSLKIMAPIWGFVFLILGLLAMGVFSAYALFDVGHKDVAVVNIIVYFGYLPVLMLIWWYSMTLKDVENDVVKIISELYEVVKDIYEDCQHVGAYNRGTIPEMTEIVKEVFKKVIAPVVEAKINNFMRIKFITNFMNRLFKRTIAKVGMRIIDNANKHDNNMKRYNERDFSRETYLEKSYTTIEFISVDTKGKVKECVDEERKKSKKAFRIFYGVCFFLCVVAVYTL